MRLFFEVSCILYEDLMRDRAGGDNGQKVKSQNSKPHPPPFLFVYLLFPKHSYSLTNIGFLEYEHTIYYQSNAWSDEKIGGTTQ